MTPAASIIVPTRDRAGIIAHTLPLLLAQSIPPEDYEVVVIDDGSSDATPEVAARLECARLSYHQVPHAGRAAARNRALERARGDLLVFLDDDAFVRPDYLERLLAFHRGKPDLMVTGPIINVVEIPRELPLPASLREGFHRNPYPTCNASVRRAHTERTGGFDESFRQYGWEDLEFSRRLLKAGLKRRFSFQTPIYHYSPHHQPAFLRSLAKRIAFVRERGAMGAHFYRKDPALAVAWMTKTWWPFMCLHRLAGRIFPLDEEIRRILEAPDQPVTLSNFRKEWLVLHAELGAAYEALRPGAHP